MSAAWAAKRRALAAANRLDTGTLTWDDLGLEITSCVQATTLCGQGAEMGLAWVPEDTSRPVLPGVRRDPTPGPRHRRPTLLVRGGHAVADLLTALARTDPPARQHARQLAVAARRYWT
jgi:hypothetical protein